MFRVKTRVMKKLFFIFFVFNIFYITQSFAETNVGGNYVVCAADADGAIYVNDEGANTGNAGDLSSFAYASDPNNYDLIATGNVDGNSEDVGASCDITPDNYLLKFHKLGFCKEDPYRTPINSATNTIANDLSSCVDIFDSSAGKEVNIRPDEEVDLLEADIDLPLGSYPYMYAILDNVVKIKHSQKFVKAPGGSVPNFKILGYKENATGSNNTNEGKTCWTVKKDDGRHMVETFTSELSESGGVTTLRGYDLPLNYTGSQRRALFKCGDANINAGLDYFVTIINSISGNAMCAGQNCNRDGSRFRNAGKADPGFNPNFPNISQSYNLLKEDYTIATDPADVERMLWVQYNPDNIINITENTVGLKLNFKTNNAMSMGVQQLSDDDDMLLATRIKGKTIFGQVQTKTRRSRGAWR